MCLYGCVRKSGCEQSKQTTRMNKESHEERKSRRRRKKWASEFFTPALQERRGVRVVFVADDVFRPRAWPHRGKKESTQPFRNSGELFFFLASPSLPPPPFSPTHSIDFLAFRAPLNYDRRRWACAWEAPLSAYKYSFLSHFRPHKGVDFYCRNFLPKISRNLLSILLIGKKFRPFLFAPLYYIMTFR